MYWTHNAKIRILYSWRRQTDRYRETGNKPPVQPPWQIKHINTEAAFSSTCVTSLHAFVQLFNVHRLSQQCLGDSRLLPAAEARPWMHNKTILLLLLLNITMSPLLQPAITRRCLGFKSLTFLTATRALFFLPWKDMAPVWEQLWFPRSRAGMVMMMMMITGCAHVRIKAQRPGAWTGVAIRV